MPEDKYAFVKMPVTPSYGYRTLAQQNEIYNAMIRRTTARQAIDRAAIMVASGLDAQTVEPLDPFPTFWPPLETLAAFQTANRRRNMREDHEMFSFGDGICALIAVLFVFFLLGTWLGVL
jgi:hypothetical protein